MVGQVVGATGESPKDDRQSRVLRGTVPPKMPVATKSCFISRLLLRIPIVPVELNIDATEAGLVNSSIRFGS
jgi:hypothetical protein